MITNLKVISVAPVGATGQHVRLIAEDSDQSAKFIGFRFGARLDELQPGATIDVAVEASWNSWNNRKERQLKLTDWRVRS